MTTLKTVLIVFQIIFSLLLTFIVLMQQGKSAGLSGAISGAADTFLSKNKAKTWDVRLAKLTTLIAFLFIATTIAVTII